MRNQNVVRSLALVLVSLVSACGGATLGGDNGNGGTTGGTTGGVTPTGIVATLELTSAQGQIVANGTSAAVLTATLLDTAGQPVSGKTLNFNTTAGTLSTNPANGFAGTATTTTNSSGKAVVYLRSTTQVGTASVSAVEPVTGLTGTTPVQFTSGGGVVPNLFVSPGTVAPGGRVTVTVQVTDVNGNPVKDVGLLLSATSRSGGQFLGNISPTDSNGVSTIDYSAGPSPATDTFKVALAGGQSAFGSLSVVLGTASIGGIQLSLGAPTAIADGLTRTAANASVTDTSGNPVPNTPVTFSTTAGSLTAGSSSGSAVSANTDGSGVARAFVVSPTRVGQATVTAATAGFSNTAQITFVAGGVAAIGVSASPASVSITNPSAPSNNTSMVRVALTDANGNPVANQTVTLSFVGSGSGLGTLSPLALTSDNSGLATATYTAPASTGSTSTATDTITARVANTVSNIQNASIAITTPAKLVGSVGLSAGDLAPAASTTQTLTATVLDKSGNPFSGQTVTFSATKGMFGAAPTPTDANGVSTVSYTAPNSAGQATVSATTGGVTAQRTLNVSAVATSVTLITSNPTLQSGATTTAQGVTLTALVKDASNKLLSGIPVTFSSAAATPPGCGNGGALAVTTTPAGAAGGMPAGTTDNNGEAAAILTTGGDPQNQTIRVTASASGKSTSIDIPVTGTKLQLAGPGSLSLGGTASYIATLRDSNNKGIPNQQVTVKSVANPPVNNLAPTTGATDASGQLTVNYTGTNAGNDLLQAFTTNNSCNTQGTQAVTISGQTLRILSPDASSEVVIGEAPVVKNDAGSFIIAAVSATQTVPMASAADVNSYALGDAVRISDGTGAAMHTINGTIASLNPVAAPPSLTVTTTTIVAGAAGQTMAAGATVERGAVAARLTGASSAGRTISFTTTRGVFTGGAASASAITDANGVAVVYLSQPTGVNGTGGGVVTATGPNGISDALGFAVVSHNPTKISLQVQPANIPVNSGVSTIQAQVSDTDNNPVKDAEVDFTLVDNSGGSLAASRATTDSQGRASTTYSASSRPSGKDAVQITGAVVNSAGTVLASDSKTLTVGGTALRITLGTGNTLRVDSPPSLTLNHQPYTVTVTDSAGNPPPTGSTVSLLVESLAYQKGFLACRIDPTTGAEVPPWVPFYTVAGSALQSASVQPPVPPFGCINEDANRNGILDASSSEDFNNNGVLDPGNVADVPSSVALDTAGHGTFEITYPKDHSNWVQVRLTASISVAGTESKTTTAFVLVGLASEYADCKISPPGQISPYGGVATNCSVGDNVPVVSVGASNTTLPSSAVNYSVDIPINLSSKSASPIRVPYQVTLGGRATEVSVTPKAPCSAAAPDSQGNRTFDVAANATTCNVTVTFNIPSAGDTVTFTLFDQTDPTINASISRFSRSVRITAN